MTKRALAAEMQGRRAGFVSRMTAAAIDVTLVAAFYFLVLVAIGAVRYLASDDPFEVADPPGWLNGTAVLLLLAFALAIAWSGSGRTPGDSAVGLRVVRVTGEELGFARALARGLVLVALPLVSMGWILVSRKNAGLHDLACKTTVIYDWRPRDRVRATAATPRRVGAESRQNSKILR